MESWEGGGREGRREGALVGGRGDSELGTVSVPAGGAAVEWRGMTVGVSKERIRMSVGDSIRETACDRNGLVRHGFRCVHSRPDDCHISLSFL